jgi:hypothetical protein
MTDSNIFKLNKPDQRDPLQEVLREGARKMLAAAIETEVSDFIKQHGSLKTDFAAIHVDIAIEIASFIRQVFHLPLRQTKNIMNSLLVMSWKLKSPFLTSVAFPSAG